MQLSDGETALPESINIVITPEEQPYLALYTTDSRDRKVLVRSYDGRFLDSTNKVYELKIHIGDIVFQPLLDGKSMEELVNTYVIHGFYLITASGETSQAVSQNLIKLQQYLEENSNYPFYVSKSKKILGLGRLIPEVKAQTCGGQARGCRTIQSQLTCAYNTSDPSCTSEGQSCGPLDDYGVGMGTCVQLGSGGYYCYASGSNCLTIPLGELCNEFGAKCQNITECTGYYTRECAVQLDGLCRALECNPAVTCSETAPNCYWSASCSCASWTNGSCGGGSCSATQRQQTRTCTPSGCDSQTRCVSDVTCGGFACTVDLTPSTSSFSVGSAQSFTANLSGVSGTVDRVEFASNNTSIATVNPSQDASSPYTTDATGVAVGTTSVDAFVIMGGNPVCNDSAAVNVSEAGPWWQVIDADIFSLGNLISEIPAGCSGACTPMFDLDGPGGFPGLPIYTGTYDFSDGSGQGTASSTNWLAEATFSDTRTYNYSFFDKRVPADATLNEITSPSIPGTDITSGGTAYDGYYWYHYDGDTYGDLAITSDVTIAADRKVILFVESADLDIQGNISIQTDGQGFLLVIVGETASATKGNITIDSSVGGTGDGVPEIEGLFLADNTFSTGTTGAGNDNQLHIRGSVAAYGGINLERDLIDDSETPAELFEYAPELMLLFPDSLGLERMRWEEVAP
jgi:hypothetical protein